MINENSLVIYKNKPAIVKDKPNGKFSIFTENGELIKVRDKDIELIHPGPVKDFKGIENCKAAPDAVREAWELLADNEDMPHTLKDLASLIFSEYTPSSAFASYCLLRDGLYFSGNTEKIVPRSRKEIDADEVKRGEKQREIDERASFLERLKKSYKNPVRNQLLPDDARFMQDVEALAFGKSAKSRTMKELGLGETPEEAHGLLLNTGIWTASVNPYPLRFGLSLNQPSICPQPPPPEERVCLCHLASFAIDSPHSNDPDDAVSVEISPDGMSVLYVHIADPASSIKPDSPAEHEARNRGVTLYLPEGAVRMLAEESLPMFAFGYSEKSPALTFKMTLDKRCMITETSIFPSLVKVKRITYEEADNEMDAGSSPALCALFELAQRNYRRRTVQGAVNIEMPEINITVKEGIPEIEKVFHYRSFLLVRECMIIAGEGAGTWAAGKRLPFPFISQDVELQGEIFEGLAGSWQLRRCMRPRIHSVKPGRHQGLGLDTYTHVTSPLRRYTDLLAHMQIRAFLCGGKLLCEDEVSAHLGFSEATSVAASQAERASCNHWTMVYLSERKDSVWDAIALEKKGNRWVVIIPSLALETQVPLQKNVSPNDTVQLTLKSVNIPRGEAVFVHITRS